MCPKPTVPEPDPTPPTRHREEPLAQGEADPEGGGDAPARDRGCGRAGVVVEVKVGAEDGGEAEAEVHKEI